MDNSDYSSIEEQIAEIKKSMEWTDDEIMTNETDDETAEVVAETNSLIASTQKEEGNIIFKKEIPITLFLGVVVYFNWMFIQNYVQIDDISKWYMNDDVKFLLNLDFWAFISTIGIKKAGFVTLCMNLWKILIDSSKTPEEKLNMAMIVIQQWLEVLADLSMIVASQKE